MATYNTQRRWTEQEDEQLRELAKAGKSVKQISEITGRTIGSLRHRGRVLSITFAKTYAALRSMSG